MPISLLLGDLRSVDQKSLTNRPSLVYWNDVFEHICPDEISDYLEKIYSLLVPGGSLVTITPNWLLRPFRCDRRFLSTTNGSSRVASKRISFGRSLATVKESRFPRRGDTIGCF